MTTTRLYQNRRISLGLAIQGPYPSNRRHRRLRRVCAEHLHAILGTALSLATLGFLAAVYLY